MIMQLFLNYYNNWSNKFLNSDIVLFESSVWLHTFSSSSHRNFYTDITFTDRIFDRRGFVVLFFYIIYLTFLLIFLTGQKLQVLVI